MIRTGIREKMVSLAVIFLVMFLVIESYIGDINTVGVEPDLVEANEEFDNMPNGIFLKIYPKKPKNDNWISTSICQSNQISELILES